MILGIDENITTSTQSAIALKERFSNVLDTMHIMSQLKESFINLEKAEKFLEAGNLPQVEELLAKLKNTLDEQLSDHITQDMEEFFQKQIREIEVNMRMKMEQQLTDWIDNLKTEQDRVGQEVRFYAEDKLLKASMRISERPQAANTSFRDTYKASFNQLNIINESTHKTLF